MKHGLFVPPFGELSNPNVLAAIARRAEDAGFDGVFVWDHIMRPDPSLWVCDTTVALSAIALATSRVAIGPMVTPLVRRRVQKFAREITSLDHVSQGRVIVGLGLGVDTGRELSAFGDPTDQRVRSSIYDESIRVAKALWSGDLVNFAGEHLVADGVRFQPVPVQRPHPPLWAATRTMNRVPLRRAATLNGLFPIELSPEQVGHLRAEIAQMRDSMDDFDIVAIDDGEVEQQRWLEAGVTWLFHGVSVGEEVSSVNLRIDSFGNA